MKTILLLICTTLITLCNFAQTDSLKIATKVKAVTVYPEGAQITREISLTHKLGKSILIFEDLPYEINQDNLQLGCNKLQHISALKLEKVYGSSQGKQKETLALEAEIDAITLTAKHLNNKLELLKIEKDLLLKNSKLNSESTTIPLEELKQTVAYFNKKMETIETAKLNIALEKEGLKDQIKTINKQLQALRNKRNKNTSRLIVTIHNKTTKKANYTLSYFHEYAGWVPDYNLRVENIDQPLTADYNATVFQSTGEDWKEVNLTLSTITPTINESNIELGTWVLEQKNAKKHVQPVAPPKQTQTLSSTSSLRGVITDASSGETIPMANIVIKKNYTIVHGGATDFDGRYIISPLSPGNYTVEVSYIGYATQTFSGVIISPSKSTELNVELKEDNGLLEEVSLVYEAPLIDADKTGTTIHMNHPPRAYSSSPRIRTPKTPKLKAPIQSIVDNILQDLKQEITYPEFKIDAPFTILADSRETNVRIKSLKIPTDYHYHIIPKVQQYAFLQAQIPNWTTYEFLSGNAKIYLKGKFIGQTFLDTDNFSDTLNLQLGKETDIQVKRSYEQNLGGKITSGNKIKETIAYTIVVKNNKPFPIQITIEDQIPITRRKDISIELLESAEAKVNPKIGQLKWDITLNPKEKKEINFSYLAKYPKF